LPSHTNIDFITYQYHPPASLVVVDFGGIPQSPLSMSVLFLTCMIDAPTITPTSIVAAPTNMYHIISLLSSVVVVDEHEQSLGAPLTQDLLGLSTEPDFDSDSRPASSLDPPPWCFSSTSLAINIMIHVFSHFLIRCDYEICENHQDCTYIQNPGPIPIPNVPNLH